MLAPTPAPTLASAPDPKESALSSDTAITAANASMTGAVSPSDTSAERLKSVQADPAFRLEQKQEQQKEQKHAQKQAPTLTLASVEQQLRQTLAQALFMDEAEVKDDASFIDMGLDSIVGVEWVREINRLFQLALPVTELYDFPTIPQLAAHIYAYISAAHISVAHTSTAEKHEPGVAPQTQTALSQKKHAQVPTSGNATGLVVSTVQTLQDITVSPWQVNAPGAGEITLSVKASAVNFPDAMCVNGLYPTMPAYPFVPGFEVAGVVTDLGEGVSEFAIGDEVIALTGEAMGGHASVVNVPADNSVLKPSHITFEEACSLPVAFGIVYYAYALAQLQPNEKVLVQTATGGCGLLGIQLARLAGCEVLGTSSRAEKLAILRRLNVPHGINYKTEAFDQRIAAITNNQGVDAVLNMLSSEYIQAGLNSLAPGGRYLEIAVHALKTSPKLDLSGLVNNQSIHSIDLRRLNLGTGSGFGSDSGESAKSQLQAMVALLEAELITPILSRVYPFSDIAGAIQYVGQGQHIGKVVISHTCEQMIDYTDMCIARMLEQQRNAEQRVQAGKAGIFPDGWPSPYLNSSYSSGSHYNSTALEQQTKPVADFAMPTQVEANPLLEPVSGASQANTSGTATFPEAIFPEPIAVVGMAGQFPQSPDLASFWHNLKNGVDCVTEVSPQRWSTEQFYDPDPQAPGKTNCKWMGALPDADTFDPAFFNISPNEAVAMDPQQRKILETSWHCIEEAGINADDLSGALCGIFIGVAPGDYGMNADDDELSSHGLMGRSMSILSARTAFFLNLKGPCITLDTACSSSLVAIAEACNNLVLGNCDVALAGGVNVMATPNLHVMTSKAEMLSPDGRCYTFDNRANGFVPCEGVGMLLLKTLSAAQRNGDTIKGLVRGWGVNQDGKTNGITAPSTVSQTELAQRVYQRFAISPDSIELIEAHGTGTKLGDPIEIRALKQAFSGYTTDAGYCALGSVKSSIGHGLASAGVAGAIKVLLALQHKVIPPLANFTQLNEHIDLTDSPFYIPTEAQNWQSYHVDASSQNSSTQKNAAQNKKQGKRAAVSSFGFSGTNAHLVFEAAPEAKRQQGNQSQDQSASEKSVLEQTKALPFVISARNIAQLTARVQQISDYLQAGSGQNDINCNDLAYTLLTGRRLFKQRIVLIAASVLELQLLLNQVLPALQSAVNQANGNVDKKDKGTELTDTLNTALNTIGGVFYDKVKNAVKPDLAQFDAAEQTLATWHRATNLSHLSKTNLSELAALLVQGYKLPFAQLFGVAPEQRFTRLSLPLYPFAKQRFWLEPSAHAKPIQAEAKPASGHDNSLQNSPAESIAVESVSVELASPDSVLALPANNRQVLAKPVLSLSDASFSSSLQIKALKPKALEQAALISPATDITTFDITTIEITDHGGSVFSIRFNLCAEHASSEQRLAIYAQQLSAALTQLAAQFSALAVATSNAQAATEQVDSDQRRSVPKVIVLQQLHLLPAITASPQATVYLRDIANAILHCELPVVTQLQPDATQNLSALIAASAGDLLVLQNSTDEYRWSLPQNNSVNDAATDLAAFINERFDVVLSEQAYQFEFCNEKRNGLLYCDDAEQQTWRLAYQLAEKPLIALQQLKAHLAAPLRAALSYEQASSLTSGKNASPLASGGNALNQAQWLHEFAIEFPTCKSADSPDAHSLSTEDSRTFNQIVHLAQFSNGVVELVLQDEAQHNMLSNDMMDAISDAFEHIATLPQAKVVIITGYAQYFSLGGTKAGLQSIHSGEVKFTDSTIYSIAMQCPLPVIAAIQGHGIGAGWALGMYADFVLLGQESIYISPYMNYGFTPGAGATLVFTRKYGKDLGREMLFTAREYTGRELAQRSNAITVLPRAQVLSSARYLANQLAQQPLNVLKAFKDKNNTQANTSLANHIQQVYALEQAMHQVTFVGNAEVLAGIESRFVDNLHEQTSAHAQTHTNTRTHTPLASTNQASTDPKGNDTMNPSDVSIDKQSLREVLISTLAEQLGMDNDEIETDQEFVELGLDSVVGVTWIRKINETYQLNVAVTKVYQYPTIDQLSEYIFGLVSKTGSTKGPKTEPTMAAQAAPAAKPAETQPVQTAPTQAVKVALNLGGAASVPASETTASETKETQTRAAETKASVTDQSPSPIHSSQTISPAQLAKDIAIIGMAGRFPKAADINEFWHNISQQHDCVEEVPSSRWDIASLYDPDPRSANKTYSKWMGRVDGVEYFDPLFFSISPQEALAMDPQQRLILQESWHCLENAGYNPDTLAGSLTGVYIGCGPNDYGYVHANDMDAEGLTGSSASILTGRISYQLNLQGPCVAIDTACSSSLVAIAQACDALVLHNCDMALAGGVCVMAGPTIHVMTSNAGMLSPDGRCFTFDQRANGFVPGEGVGVALLKRLADAERDGDRIDAIIAGWGTNQDGKTNGITAPNPESQTRLQRSVYDRFNIDPSQIQLIETHGTGTKLGDPIEIEALAETYAHYAGSNQSAVSLNKSAIGSVKSNIGHAQAAAGIASVMKVVLALQHKQLPPTANFAQLNEHISLAGTPFFINTELSDWAKPQTTSQTTSPGASARHATVSSFGFSGTNAHLVLREYEEQSQRVSTNASVNESAPALVLLSARTSEQLLTQLQQLRAFVSKQAKANFSLANMAYTLQVGRKAMEHRLAMLCQSTEDFLKKADKLLAKADGKLGKSVKLPKKCYLGEVSKDKSALAMFSDNDELKASLSENLSKWLKKQKLAPLAELWVKGIHPDWAQLYQELSQDSSQAHQRLALPTYPFAQQRFWIDAAPDSQSEGAKSNAAKAPKPKAVKSQAVKTKAANTKKAEKPPLKEDEQLRITEVWRDAPLTDIARLQALLPQLSDQSAAADISPIRVLVLFQTVREGENLVEELAEQIDTYAPVLKDKVQIRREQIATMDEAFYLDLQAQPADVIFLLGAGKPALNGSDSPQEKVLKPIFELARNMVAHNSSHHCDLYYCASDPMLAKQIDTDALQAQQFTLFQQGLSGLFRAIGAEAPAKLFRTISHAPEDYRSGKAYGDIVGEWLSSWFRAKATALQPNAPVNQTAPAQNAMIRYLPELEVQSSAIRQIARLEELPIESAEADKQGAQAEFAAEKVSMRVGGTYLIAGGLGEVGLAVCQKLAEQYQPTLVFLSRRTLAADGDELSAQLQTLSDAGATVHYFSVDINDYAALESVYSDIKQALNGGNINGVWHFARQVNDARIEHKTTREFFDTVSAKTIGTIHLDTVTQHEPLDFFLMFSSMAAFGIEGSCDYGYATGFQNHFARYRNRLAHMNLRSGLGCAICWGQWTLDKYSNEQRDLLLWQMGFDFITPDQAITLTDILLQTATQTDGVAGVMAINDKNRVRKFYQLPTLFAAPVADKPVVEKSVSETQAKTSTNTSTNISTNTPTSTSISTSTDTSMSDSSSNLSVEQVLQSVNSSTPEHEISRLKARLLTQSTDELVAIYQKLVNEE